MSVRAAFAIPGDLATLTGGYGYDREALARVPAYGVDVRHLALPQGFPFPSVEALAQTQALLADVEAGDVLLCDGLAYGAVPAPILKQVRAKIVALVHHPLALETGLSAQAAQSLFESEKVALTCARAVIVSSHLTKDILIRDYGVEARRIHVALPGTERAPRAVGSGGSVHLLAVGSVVPRKAYDVLLSALETCTDLDWSLTIAGSLARAPEYADEVLRHAASALSDRIQFAGEVSAAALEALYARSDLFVMSSHFEGYGMVLGEAMVRGLPIVMTCGGAMAQTVPEGVALTVAPGDVHALGQSLRQAISDRALRQRLAEASYAAGQDLPTWDETAQIIAQVLKEVAA